MSKQKQPFVPKIGQKVYIKRQNSLGEPIYFEGIVTRIRVEVKCKDCCFSTHLRDQSKRTCSRR